MNRSKSGPKNKANLSDSKAWITANNAVMNASTSVKLAKKHQFCIQNNGKYNAIAKMHNKLWSLSYPVTL